MGVGCGVCGVSGVGCVGCGVSGVGCWVLGVGYRVLGVGCQVSGVGCWGDKPSKTFSNQALSDIGISQDEALLTDEDHSHEIFPLLVGEG
ncbi:MAG: hypothetical protein RIB93_19625 [Coleofasciculus sp. D1-CHI-01]|uniref:hypothetical protein n=1 Tax=Coleofasciculus sp. D1-CHI-01 TaxID=3068482 RepID=UPI0032F367FE